MSQKQTEKQMNNINKIISQIEKKDKLYKEKMYNDVAKKVIEIMNNGEQNNNYKKPIIYLSSALFIFIASVYVYNYVSNMNNLVYYESFYANIYMLVNIIKYYTFYLRYLMINMFIQLMSSIGISIDIVQENFTW